MNKAHRNNIFEFQAAPTESLWKLLFSLMSYRRKMPVTEIRIFPSNYYGETGYYVCPRCSVTLEREFMAYCDRCGQRLDWRDYKKAREIHPEPHDMAHP